MSIERRRNPYLPANWNVYVNDAYISEFEAQAQAFAEQLERRVVELKDRGSAQNNSLIAVQLLVAPDQSVITRALQIMRKRGFSVTCGDRLPGQCSAEFMVRRVK
ncbi:MAG: hypothetical protein EKK48_19085 [Candidatus Melainabacteria bacterium]|nr:MAG: hypothetical protein EKK48_19085 [Candidatus Melainabacteria bacterium]